MGGLKFLITLVVIYLIFRSIMRKVLSSVNSEGGGALKGKLGDVIEQMKQEMEKARLEAEREAAGEDDEDFMDDDPWEELRGGSESYREEILEEDSVISQERWEADDERPSLHERWEEGDDSPALHERWNAEDERPDLHERWEATDDSASLWDSPEGGHKAKRVSPEARTAAIQPCDSRRKHRMRLKEAVIWKEILDRPVGLR
ncbi:hypothetical protein [Desulfoluna spongiiphila]|uniref:Uncharacterized protein n=1 Tax=Desulfoluna spongiiphila TaxID=419481 RepID=A0A1G5I9L8_9BACT|nr:hypothetical protein [Desulfoluna spongiiphila]SCY72724.1 hypothetical protein SAMN05216233_11891 [Desulfoluna spongiiphila]VVS93171.1 consensus disorder prediction [Desulfoluna spongiiphila]